MYKQEAELFLRHYRFEGFWCGTAVGGCGERLSAKIYRYETCRFAHYPSAMPFLRRMCAPSPRRVARLAGRRGIENWLSLQRLMPDWNDGVWTEDLHGFEFTYQMCPRRLRVETAWPGWTDGASWWRARRAEVERDGAIVDWIFNVDESEPDLSEMIARHGRAFLMRTELRGFEPALEIGTVLGKTAPVWEPMNMCVYTPENGLMTTASARADGLILPTPPAPVQVPLPTRTPASPTESPAVPSPPLPVPPERSAAERVAHDRAARVRSALRQAARHRRKVTWIELDASLGGYLRVSQLTAQERARLLVDVERLAGSDSARLSALLVQGHPEDRELDYLRDVMEAAGVAVPVDESDFTAWRREQYERAGAEADADRSAKGVQNVSTHQSMREERITQLQVTLAEIQAELDRNVEARWPAVGNAAYLKRTAEEVRAALALHAAGRNDEELAKLLAQAEALCVATAQRALLSRQRVTPR